MVTSQENGLPAPGINIALKDETDGTINAETATGVPVGGFNYMLAAPNVTHRYYAIPAVNRKQSAAPNSVGINLTETPSQEANFTIRGIKATVIVSAVSGSFILMTPTSYGSSHAPKIYPAQADGPYYETTVGPGNTGSLQVPPGHTYWLTCWIPNHSEPLVFTKTQKSLDGILAPNAAMNEECSE